MMDRPNIDESIGRNDWEEDWRATDDTTMPELLALTSDFHDSYLEMTRFDWKVEGVLWIRLYDAWCSACPRRPARRPAPFKNWLGISFERVYQVMFDLNVDAGGNIIGEAVCEAVSGDTRQAWLGAPSGLAPENVLLEMAAAGEVHRTVFHEVCGGSIHFLHSPKITVLWPES